MCGLLQIVKILDDVAGRQAATNRKVVQKAKQKAIKDADERVKKLDKMVKEHEAQMKKDEKQSKNKGGRGTIKTPSQGISESSFSDVLNSRVTKRDSLMASDPSEGASKSNRKRGDGDGTSSTGLPASDSSSVENSENGETLANYQDSRFWLPNRNSNAMMSLAREGESIDIDDALATLDSSIDDATGDPSEAAKQRRKPSDRDNGSHHSRTAKPGDSISTVFRGDQAMWAEFEIDLEDDVDASSSAIELFLTVNDLEDYIPVFFDEDIDMKALELLTDQDILDLKLPLGPRRKLNQAIAKRKEALATPGAICDSAI